MTSEGCDNNMFSLTSIFTILFCLLVQPSGVYTMFSILNMHLLLVMSSTKS